MLLLLHIFDSIQGSREWCKLKWITAYNDGNERDKRKYTQQKNYNQPTTDNSKVRSISAREWRQQTDNDDECDEFIAATTLNLLSTLR